MTIHIQLLFSHTKTRKHLQTALQPSQVPNNSWGKWIDVDKDLDHGRYTYFYIIGQIYLISLE